MGQKLMRYFFCFECIFSTFGIFCFVFYLTKFNLKKCIQIDSRINFGIYVFLCVIVVEHEHVIIEVGIDKISNQKFIPKLRRKGVLEKFQLVLIGSHALTPSNYFYHHNILFTSK